MGRRRSVKAIDAKTDDVKERIISAEKRYDSLCRELSVLQEERDQIMT